MWLRFFAFRLFQVLRLIDVCYTWHFLLHHCFLDIKKESGGWSIYRRKELFPLNCILVNFSYSLSVFYVVSISGLWILFNYTHENAFLLSWHSFAEITFFKGDHSWKLPMQSPTKGKKSVIVWSKRAKKCAKLGTISFARERHLSFVISFLQKFRENEACQTKCIIIMMVILMVWLLT